MLQVLQGDVVPSFDTVISTFSKWSITTQREAIDTGQFISSSFQFFRTVVFIISFITVLWTLLSEIKLID